MTKFDFGLFVRIHTSKYVVTWSSLRWEETEGRRCGVGVMKDKEIKLKEIEVSHKLGGVGKGRVQGREKWRGCRRYTGIKHRNTFKNVLSRLFHQRLGFVEITNGHVCMCERGTQDRGGCGFKELSSVMYIYILRRTVQ